MKKDGNKTREEITEKTMSIKNSKMIIKNVENKRHKKDITLDLLELLLAKRLNMDQRREKPRSKMSNFMTFLKVMSIVATIALSVFLIGFNYMRNHSLGENGSFSVHDDCSEFKHIPIYGKDRTIDSIIQIVVSKINVMNKFGRTPYIHDRLQATSKNFLFYGEPGTGKTLIVKKMAYYLDIQMRLMREIKNEEKKKVKTNFSYEYLSKLKPAIKLIIVQPSSLIDKFVGSTEKNIKSLFDTANKLAKTNAVIIFIDEIDAFFGKRNLNTSEHGMNCKTEFLCNLDGVKTNLSAKIFLFGATNLKDHLDDAFSRRLGNHFEFAKPTLNEIKTIVKKITEGYIWHDANEIEKIARKLEGKSHYYIRAVFGKLRDQVKEKWPSYTYEMIRTAIDDYDKTQLPKENDDVEDYEKPLFRTIPKIADQSL